MKRLAILLLTALLLGYHCMAQTTDTSHRKKVAVVLSGGGAKGMAHIGALKVIEKAGIPIDIIVGTSMGSIIGGLYAIGYTPEQLDSLVTTQNWGELFSNGTKRTEQFMVDKQRAEQFTLSVPFKNKPKDAFRAGVITGDNISQLFSELTAGYHDSIDFNKLPVPFACVCENLVDGKEYVFHSGKLALAMRSSMSIPGVFEPVKWNGMVLVDGGMCNNYPVDVAKAMGADMVIGVDVKDQLITSEKLNSLADIVAQIINLMDVSKYNENVQNSDIHIHVDGSGYSAASFNKDAITVLVERGEHAAMRQWQHLMDLKKQMGLPENFEPQKHGPFDLNLKEKEDNHKGKAKTIPELISRQTDNMIGVGVRFDNESLAALILNTYINLNQKKTQQAALTVRLGRQLFGRLDYTTQPFHPLWNLNLAYQINYDDMDLYNNGDKFSTFSYTRNLLQINISRSWLNTKTSLGVRYEHYNFNNILLPPGYDDGDLNFADQHQIAYYGQMEYDSYDRRTYPTKGHKWYLKAELYSDNGVEYQNKNIVPVFSGYWEASYKILERFSILPWLSGRTILNKEYNYPMANMVGGNTPGRYLAQQLPFVGINYMQLTGSKLFTTGLRFRQRIGSSQYVTGTVNMGVQNDEWDKLFDNPMWGGGATYGYDTFLGPLEITFDYSNVTKALGVYVSLGYSF